MSQRTSKQKKWRSTAAQRYYKTHRLEIREKRNALHREKMKDPNYREAFRLRQKRRRHLARKQGYVRPKEVRTDGIRRMYFIQTTSGPIKIGFTSKLVRIRMQELQVGNHEELVLLAAVPSTRDQEHQVHRRFEHLLIRGEWFHPAPELLQFILSLTAEKI